MVFCANQKKRKKDGYDSNTPTRIIDIINKNGKNNKVAINPSIWPPIAT